MFLGGSNSLQGYNRKDIEEKFKKIEHSPAAEYLLKDYKLKEQTTSESELDESLEVKN